jgi:acyl-CoA dehydrogenase
MGKSSLADCNRTSYPFEISQDVTRLHADLQWISGAGDPRNAVHIVLAVTDPSNASPHKRHSLILVDPKQKGVNVVRPMQVFGYDDAPEGHCEVKYQDVKVDVESGVVGGKAGLGRGFEIIQARLGYVLDMASNMGVKAGLKLTIVPEGYTIVCDRSVLLHALLICCCCAYPTPPGRLSESSSENTVRVYQSIGSSRAPLIAGTVLADIAHSRAEIDQSRLLVLAAARQIDIHGAKGALKEIGLAKVSYIGFCLPAKPS